MIPASLRHDWPVRWAHHPLCARHRAETLRLGRLHLCRGCASVMLGMLAGGVVVTAVSAAVLPWMLLALPPVLLLSWPPRYRRLPRGARDLLRLVAGALLVLACWATLRHPLLAWPLLPLLFGLWRWYARARARVQARACDGCPELGRRGVCSGYALQASCQRALQAQVEHDLGLPLAGSGALPLRIRPKP